MLVAVDTNILIGLFRKETEPKAKEYRDAVLQFEDLFVPTAVVAEVYTRMLHLYKNVVKAARGSFTLEDAKTVYRSIHHAFEDLQESYGVQIEYPEVEEAVASILIDTGLDWVNAYLLHIASTQGFHVASSDKALSRALKTCGKYYNPLRTMDII